MAMGQGGAEGCGLCLTLHGFFLFHFHPALHEWENILSHPCPLGPCDVLSYPVKLYFLLICPTTITIFSNNIICFNNKNIFEIINKFIASNQTNF